MSRKEADMNSITFCNRAVNFFTFLHFLALIADIGVAIASAIIIKGAVGFGYFVAIMFGGGMAIVFSFFLIMTIFYSLGERIKLRQAVQALSEQKDDVDSEKVEQQLDKKQ